MNSSKFGQRQQLYLLFLIPVLFVPAILFETSITILLGIYLTLFALLCLPFFPLLRKWWVPITLGLIILLPGPFDRIFISVSITPEEDVNPVGVLSVIDLIMLVSILMKFRADDNLQKCLNPRINYLSFCLFLITGLAIISAVFSCLNYYTFYLPMALRTILYSIRFLLVFVWISIFFNDLKEIRKMPLTIYLVSLGFVLLVLLSPVEDPDGDNRLTVATYGLNTFGHLLTFISLLSVPFFLHYLREQRTRSFFLVFACFLICISFLLMTANRMSFGLFLFGIIVYFLMLPSPFKKKLRISIISIGVLLITIYLFSLLKPDLFARVFGIFQLISGENALNDISEMQARFVVWELSIDMITKHPWLGVGPGQWNYMKDFFGTMPSWMTTILDPHNGYLLYASEMGLICMVLYYSIIFYAIRRGFKAFSRLKKFYAANPLKEVSLYLSFILMLNIVLICWLLSDLSNASGLNIRVQSLMWSLCSILFITPMLVTKFIEKNHEN